MLLALSANVNASLINNDTYTTDTVTGFNWLDLTETNGLSYNYVSGQLGAGGDFEGYRYATNAEVVGLWGNFGFDLSVNNANHPDDGAPTGLVTAANLLGNTLNEYGSGFDYGILGYTGDSMIDGYHTRLGVYHTTVNNLYINDVIDALNQHDATTYLYNGSYLVSVSTVPVPAAAWLFGSALLGFFGFSRRKANA